jgi:hypothetical protein
MICRNYRTHLEVQMLLAMYFSSKSFQSQIYIKNISIMWLLLKMYWRRPASCFKHSSTQITGYLSHFLACMPVLSVSHPHLRLIFEAQYSEILLLRYHALSLGILESMSYAHSEREREKKLEILASCFGTLNTLKRRRTGVEWGHLESSLLTCKTLTVALW